MTNRKKCHEKKITQCKICAGKFERKKKQWKGNDTKEDKLKTCKEQWNEKKVKRGKTYWRNANGNADTVIIRIKLNASAFILFYLHNVTCQDNDTILRSLFLSLAQFFGGKLR